MHAVACTKYATRSHFSIFYQEPFVDSKAEACRRAMRGVTAAIEAGGSFYAAQFLPLVLIEDSHLVCYFRQQNAVYVNQFYYWDYGTRAGDCAAASPPAEPVIPAQTCEVGKFTTRPIALTSGAKVFRQMDLEDHGVHPLTLTRHYASRWNHAPLAAVGNAWAHAHAHRIVPSGDGTASTIQFGDGQVSNFAKVPGTGTWSAVGSQDELQETFDRYTYRKAADDSVWTFHPVHGRVLSIRSREGWTSTYAYTNGLLKQVTNHFGRKLTFTHDAQNRLATATLAGATVSYAYDAEGRLASVTYPDGKSIGYVHEDARWPDAITGVIDESGQRWANVAYDDQGRAVQSELAGAVERSTVLYASDATTVTDALGFTRTYQYQPLSGAAIGLATTAANAPAADGNDIATQVFDGQSLLASQSDFLGITRMFTWDVTRRLPTAVTEASGRAEARTTQYTWHPTLRLPLTETLGTRTTTNSYDTAGRLLSRQLSDTATGSSRTWSWTYTASGLVATETGPAGDVTTYAHDSTGNVVQATNPLGHVTTWTRDAGGRVLVETAPTGQVTSYTYDGRGRVLTLVRDGATTTLAYTPSGQLATAAFPSGHQVTYRYDAAHRLVGWQDNRGGDATYGLDALGNRTSEQLRDSGGAVIWQLARTLNGGNQVVAETLGTNQTTTYGHDANGQVTSEINSLSQATRYGLDGLKRLTAITDAANAVATLAYDARDAVTTATGFKGVATSYARNAFGDASQEASADIGTRTTQFDAAGRPSQVTDALGQATTISRDLLGRPTQLAFADGRTTVLRHDLPGADYNAPGAPNASKGHLSEAQDASGTTRWQHDLRGRVTRKVQSLANGSTQAVGYTYNAQGLPDTLVYPGGGQLKHLYNAAGQLTGLDWNGAPLVTGITWNAAGQPTGWTWAFGTPVQAQRSYDTAGRTTAISLLGRR
ncbi:DUF6531 domain-containing protein [Ramlibacter sp. Leaf400]|uniref:DUF6531 domain-containing protein n=1 Tax=Ramlibacter sp. Leaf400 TaxID=1736365 RepID=UPI0006FA3B1E|nr:DUF6531 domain-containing protein [Ramlibacter sp. Leaf400]KQT09373.1 hypothetical protein ASG30_12425 [Ramlibacter sp. Leaf400]